jgi:hypothetical protein
VDNADSFYDRLLASIGAIPSRGRSPSPPPKDQTPTPPPQPRERVSLSPTPPSPTPPSPQAKPILQTNVLSESPKELSPVQVKREEEVVPASPSDQPGPAPAPAKEKPIQAPPAPKNSATLEAELRAKLLASTKKRKASVPPRPAPPPPAKRPPRGSPVFTAVVPLSNAATPEEHSRKLSVTHSPVSKSFPAELTPPLFQPHGKLALPPKPPQRDGFRLRIKLPFPYSASSFITVETEKLALTTPISAILDLFNRRSPEDHLYFASPSPQPVADGPNDTPAEGAGLGIGADNGQRFYRDPPRNMGTGGWRDAAPSRGGPNWDPNVGNLRSTLEDVATVYGAEVVDCEIRSDPRPRSAHRSGTAGTDKNGYFEEEEEGWEGEGEGEGEGEEWVSPAMEQGGWDYNDPSYIQQQPQQPQWAMPWTGAFPNPMVHMPWMMADPAFQQHMAEPEPEPAQRWIPGHQDYDNAAWRFGFPKDEEARQAPSRPPPPPPTQVDILKVHGSRKQNIVETLPSTPVGPTPTAGPAQAIPQGPSAAAGPSIPQGPRTRNPLHEGKKKNKKKGGAVQNGSVKKKKGKDAAGKGGRGRGGG